MARPKLLTTYLSRWLDGLAGRAAGSPFAQFAADVLAGTAIQDVLRRMQSRELDITTDNQVTASDYCLLVDCTAGDVRLDLPDEEGLEGLEWLVVRKDGSANSLTVYPQTGGTISGASTITISTQYQTRTLRREDDGAWFIV